MPDARRRGPAAVASWRGVLLTAAVAAFVCT